MSTGFPTFSHSGKCGELGVNIVSRIISDTLGWLFRRNHQEHDFGIDGQIEVVEDDGTVTGQMFAVQIKCGESFFNGQNKWGYVYRGETKHFNYLANYPIPVVICICDPTSKDCYWVRFQADQAQVTDKGWKITIPFENALSSSKAALRAIVPPTRDSLAELQTYWAFNEIIVQSSLICYMLDQNDVRARNVLTPRAFFDHLRATKELAYQCQGKVEIGFYGYNDDPRELYEIEEVRDYVALLDAALPELFFFVRTVQPTLTLAIFAQCLTNGTLEDSGSPRGATRRVRIDVEGIIAFCERHWPGLNEMTDWLGMSAEENNNISRAAFNCSGLDPSRWQ